MNKRHLPKESSCSEFNSQSFRQNAPEGQNSQQNNNFQSSNFSSSSLYNQFIADYPLNGPLTNKNENNSRYNQSSNTPRNNFTFFDENSHFHEPIDQQKFTIGEENQKEQTSENKYEPSYDSIALQAQQLLDKLNFQDSIENSAKCKPETYNYYSPNNYITSQSSPSKKLQPILRNASFLKNRSSNQSILNQPSNPPQPQFQNQRKFKQTFAPIRNLNQNQHNNFNSNYNFSDQLNQNRNIPQRSALNQNQENEANQFQKHPQATFASPVFLSNNFEPNTKRLNTASEMVYPDNHVELLQHSFDS